MIKIIDCKFGGNGRSDISLKEGSSAIIDGKEIRATDSLIRAAIVLGVDAAISMSDDELKTWWDKQNEE